MAVYFVTGGLGAGKSLAAVGRIRDYALRGNKIAGNLDIYLGKLCSDPRSKLCYIRVPDRPTAADLMALGCGNESYDEANNGLLVLDELATWLNSQSWNEKGRKELRDWFVHARKYGWDIIFLVQSIVAVDSQLLALLMEYHVPVSRMDRIAIPFVGQLSKHFTPSGKPLTFPKVHKATVMYLDKVKADTWWYKGRELYAAYDTKQVISDSYEQGAYSQLSRWHLEGRYLGKRVTWKDYLPLLWCLPIWALYQCLQFLRLVQWSEKHRRWLASA